MTARPEAHIIRTIFPILMNDLERTILSRSAVVRTLLLREMAARQLTPAPRRPTEAVKQRVGELVK